MSTSKTAHAQGKNSRKQNLKVYRRREIKLSYQFSAFSGSTPRGCHQNPASKNVANGGAGSQCCFQAFGGTRKPGEQSTRATGITAGLVEGIRVVRNSYAILVYAILPNALYIALRQGM